MEIDYCLVIEQNLYTICTYLEPKELLQLLNVCKKIKESSQNETFWEYYCMNRWSKDFWEKAGKRPVETSKRFISMYHEFSRLAMFEYLMKSLIGYYPDSEYYYDFWKNFDLKNKN
jgi:hypothetical protein